MIAMTKEGVEALHKQYLEDTREKVRTIASAKRIAMTDNEHLKFIVGVLCMFMGILGILAYVL